MLFFYFSLGAFFLIPFFWFALAFHTWILIGVGLVFSTSILLWFLKTSFQRFVNHYRAFQNSEENDALLFQAWFRVERELGIENIKIELWLYPTPDFESFLWIKSKTHAVCFMSTGMASIIKEEQLKRLFLNYAQQDFGKVSLENSRFALWLWWSELRGSPQSYRYWFIGFWLYPFEKILKIAKY